MECTSMVQRRTSSTKQGKMSLRSGMQRSLRGSLTRLYRTSQQTHVVDAFSCIQVHLYKILIRNVGKRLIMQQHTTETTMVFERQAILRYDLEARRYRQGSEIFHVGDSLEIEVVPGVWLPVNVQGGSVYSDDGWIFTTPTGIEILPKEGLSVRRHINNCNFF